MYRNSGSQRASRFIQRRHHSLFSSPTSTSTRTLIKVTSLPPQPSVAFLSCFDRISNSIIIINNNNNNNNNNGSSSNSLLQNNNHRFFSSSSSGGKKIIEKKPKKACGTEIQGSFPMPDQDTELKLAKIQTTISDHYKNGDFNQALKASKELLKQTQDHFGTKHPATASAHNNIGLMLKLLGDFIEARQHYNTAMRIYGQVVGRDHASYAMTLHNLGALNKSQVHFDTTLKGTDRLGLVETALEYFEEAWAIRKAELGDDHPHTIATRSSYGSTLAAQVLHQHKFVEKKSQSSQAQYVSLNPQQVTQQGWKAAEEHLREAVKTAISNPRGRQINKNKNTNNKKKNKKKKSSTTTGSIKNKDIETLSAAAAAQGLAIFLKSRAMTYDPYDEKMLKESKQLYEQVQFVRSQLLPSNHPDLYATKYSFAELLDVMGDKDTANIMRQEIIDTFDPPPSSPEEEEEQQQQQEEGIKEETNTNTGTASSSIGPDTEVKTATINK